MHNQTLIILFSVLFGMWHNSEKVLHVINIYAILNVSLTNAANLALREKNQGIFFPDLFICSTDDAIQGTWYAPLFFPPMVDILL
jgi:hypothetical protein